MLSAVLGYGMGVSLFARFFRLCMQRLAACMLFLLCRQFFSWHGFCRSFQLRASVCIWMRMGVHFSRLKRAENPVRWCGLSDTDVDAGVAALHAFDCRCAPPSPAGFGTQYPKEQYRGHERFFPAYEGMYARLWLLGRFCISGIGFFGWHFRAVGIYAVLAQ